MLHLPRPVRTPLSLDPTSTPTSASHTTLALPLVMSLWAKSLMLSLQHLRLHLFFLLFLVPQQQMKNLSLHNKHSPLKVNLPKVNLPKVRPLRLSQPRLRPRRRTAALTLRSRRRPPARPSSPSSRSRCHPHLPSPSPTASPAPGRGPPPTP